jgi:hypothetical protein
VAPSVLKLVGLIFAPEAVPMWALDLPSGLHMLHIGKVPSVRSASAVWAHCSRRAL